MYTAPPVSPAVMQHQIDFEEVQGKDRQSHRKYSSKATPGQLHAERHESLQYSNYMAVTALATLWRPEEYNWMNGVAARLSWITRITGLCHARITRLEEQDEPAPGALPSTDVPAFQRLGGSHICSSNHDVRDELPSSSWDTSPSAIISVTHR